jgi:hypothetical protein
VDTEGPTLGFHVKAVDGGRQSQPRLVAYGHINATENLYAIQPHGSQDGTFPFDGQSPGNEPLS